MAGSENCVAKVYKVGNHVGCQAKNLTIKVIIAGNHFMENAKKCKGKCP